MKSSSNLGGRRWVSKIKPSITPYTFHMQNGSRKEKNIQPVGNRKVLHPRNRKQTRYHKIKQRIQICHQNLKRKRKQNSFNYLEKSLRVLFRKALAFPLNFVRAIRELRSLRYTKFGIDHLSSCSHVMGVDKRSVHIYDFKLDTIATSCEFSNFVYVDWPSII